MSSFSIMTVSDCEWTAEENGMRGVTREYRVHLSMAPFDHTGPRSWRSAYTCPDASVFLDGVWFC